MVFGLGGRSLVIFHLAFFTFHFLSTLRYDHALTYRLQMENEK